jgi:hypothetical protein
MGTVNFNKFQPSDVVEIHNLVLSSILRFYWVFPSYEPVVCHVQWNVTCHINTHMPTLSFGTYDEDPHGLDMEVKWIVGRKYLETLRDYNV